MFQCFRKCHTALFCKWHYCLISFLTVVFVVTDLFGLAFAYYCSYIPDLLTHMTILTEEKQPA